MTLRRDLMQMLSAQPRSVSSIAREMGLDRSDDGNNPKGSSFATD